MHVQFAVAVKAH